jgi:hypothetical protein
MESKKIEKLKIATQDKYFISGWQKNKETGTIKHFRRIVFMNALTEAEIEGMIADLLGDLNTKDHYVHFDTIIKLDE